MTIDEAIVHSEEVAKENEKSYRICACSSSECDALSDCKILQNGKDAGCLKCADEHRQLAEWLKELKRYGEAQEKIVEEIHARAVTPDFIAVDEAVEIVQKHMGGIG